MYNLFVPVLDLNSYIVWWKVAVAQVTLDSDLHDRSMSGLRNMISGVLCFDGRFNKWHVKYTN